MEQEDELVNSEEIKDSKETDEDNNVLKLLDSMDSYLILMDSLSLTLRQGWLEVASVRHSMGGSRISTSALFDLKHHKAATSLLVKDHQEKELHETKEEAEGKGNDSPFALDKQIKKERSKSLSSVFGGFVSPKLRFAQLSFETAVATLVEIANMGSSMLRAYDQLSR